MAIFSRRTVQRFIDEIRRLNLLKKQNLNNLIQGLNSSKPVESIACEWELIVLRALSKVSEIEYEKSFCENGSKPDVFCKLPSGECFVADITALSDKDQHENNPIHDFIQEVHKFLDEMGVLSNRIDIKVDGYYEGEYRDQKVKLNLPKKQEIPTFVRKNLLSFAKSISLNQSEPCEISINNNKITISYTPKKTFSSASYLAYNAIYSLFHNPIYNRLKSKAKQLKKSNFLGISGIFLCDGGCYSLNLNQIHIGNDQISQEKIIHKFFQNHQSVSFVVIITPEEEYAGFSTSMWKKYHRLKLFSNPNANFPLTNEISETLNFMAQYLPKPESMPNNALKHLEESPNIGLSNYEAYEIVGDTVKISSRTLAELLAGNLDINKFRSDYSQTSNFFRGKIIEGKMIEKVELEQSNDEDDDWIIIKFGKVDSAISSYQ